MMKLKVYNLFILVFITFSSFAQYELTGRIKSSNDSLPIKGCKVYLDEKYWTETDEKGNFTFPSLTGRTYFLQTTSSGYKPFTQQIKLKNKTTHIDILLESRTVLLEEVMITEQKTDFGFTRMKGIESMGIYEGKKTEVIIPDQLVANLATNNARQVYSRVAGLNIWENDGGGLQLSIGGRGLDPNRTSNFNVRQNGYDISADALGYPESYYTPPIEAVGKIQIVRGAASLQYGTQFGGLINFIMKKPVPDRKLELLFRQTGGSFGFYNAFTSASGTLGRLSYYTFFQYKSGDGWRDNSQFNNYTLYGDIDYKLSEKSTIGIDITRMNYLAQQPGGLSDIMFKQDSRQTNRARNWFSVNWNMLALHFDHKFNALNEFNLRVFGLSANRFSVGFRPNRVATIDDNSERDLIKGYFTNWGTEARYLKKYNLGKVNSALLLGARYYYGFNHSLQGQGSSGKNANFSFENPEQFITSDYEFPNQNVSFFVENVFYVGKKLSITPGVRYEYIYTTADGFYSTISKDLAGNIIDINKTQEYRTNDRNFLLGGIGISYNPIPNIDIYSNVSQNYRSITFSDMRISNPSSVIDPDMKDERGYSIDLGVRSRQTLLFNYDVSLFYLNYDNRIGEVLFSDTNNRVLRMRSNVGQAVITGIEAYGEVDFLKVINQKNEDLSGVVFTNVAFIQSEYKSSQIPGVEGNKVEFVPKMNLKTGARFGYKNLKASFQYTYLTEQFSDATNASDGGVSSVVGIIPAYRIMDMSVSYTYRRYKVEGSINNLANEMYFTRRATGYPGPGILPSDGRSFYLTLQVKI